MTWTMRNHASHGDYRSQSGTVEPRYHLFQEASGRYLYVFLLNIVFEGIEILVKVKSSTFSQRMRGIPDNIIFPARRFK